MEWLMLLSAFGILIWILGARFFRSLVPTRDVFTYPRVNQLLQSGFTNLWELSTDYHSLMQDDSFTIRETSPSRLEIARLSHKLHPAFCSTLTYGDTVFQIAFEKAARSFISTPRAVIFLESGEKIVAQLTPKISSLSTALRELNPLALVSRSWTLNIDNRVFLLSINGNIYEDSRLVGCLFCPTLFSSRAFLATSDAIPPIARIMIACAIWYDYSAGEGSNL